MEKVFEIIKRNVCVSSPTRADYYEDRSKEKKMIGHFYGRKSFQFSDSI